MTSNPAERSPLVLGSLFRQIAWECEPAVQANDSRRGRTAGIVPGIVLTLLLGLGCSPSRSDRQASEQHVEALAESAGTMFIDVDCEATLRARSARCTVLADEQELERFVSATTSGPAPNEPTFDRDESCLVLESFGEEVEIGLLPLEGVRGFEAREAAALPKSSQNVVFDRIWVDAHGDRACLEMHFPFG